MELNVVFVILALALASAHNHNDVLTRTNTYNREQSKIGIYNGNSTMIKFHRYLVGILNSTNYVCSGAIVSATWAITAADCVRNLEPSDVNVVGSSVDGVTPGVKYAVKQIVTHPNYGSDKMDYDYSCVQVVGKFHYYSQRVLKLPSVEAADNTVMTVAGYGYTSSSYKTRSLLEADMTWLPKDICRTTYAHFDFSWSDRMACVYNVDGATLCKGDYGDPFTANRVIYGMFVGGATSGFCTATAKPSILADIYPVAAWVQNVTGAEYAN